MKKTSFFGNILAMGIALVSLVGSVQDAAAQAGAPLSGEKLIRAYYAAYEKKDWNSLAGILASGFTFSSPLDDHISIKVYKERCWPNCYHVKRFEVKKLVVNGNEGFVTYNGWTTAGKLFRNTEYFEFKDGKILSDECFFGPGVNYPNSGK